MASFRETLSYLYSLQLFGIKVGLKNIRRLTACTGHPERTFPSIHIAGTNGKGSTAAMIASILTASGYRTGLYTSPHLRHFSERIRIDGVKIPEAEIVRYTKLLKPKIVETKATFFEATTAIAFKYFADQNVDIAIIETGLGGRLDATNILHPELSIITSIGMDHAEYLGSTLSSIAREKGGIIKTGVPCITGVHHTSALRVLGRIASQKNSLFIQPEKQYTHQTGGESLNGFYLRIQKQGEIFRQFFVSLPGVHQASNALLALSAVEYLQTNRGYPRINERTIADGFGNIRKYAGLRGRLDILSAHPIVIADVAHNADGIRTLVNSLGSLIGGKCVLLFGVMSDKDYKTMIRLLKPLTRLAIVVHPETSRARDVSSILEEFHGNSCRAIAASTVQHGVEIGLYEQRKNEVFLILGSHYVVGAAMENLHIRV